MKDETVSTVAKYTGLTEDETRRFVGYLLAVGLEIDESSRIAELEAQNVRLREALDTTVWRHRDQFPDNPYCILCGAGKKWSSMHGHEPSCALAETQPNASK
jgi:hypothetical protein